MLPFNAEFQSGKSKITQIRLSVLLQSGTLLNMTEANVMLGGFIRDTSTTVDGEFTIGGAVTGKLTVIIDNSADTYSGYDFRGARITANLGGQLSDESYQLVQVGIYTVDEYTYDGCNITLTAYDNLFKFDLPCKDSSIIFPKTIEQLLEEACYATRVKYPNDYVELANTSIPNGSFSVIQKPKQWDTMTWHDVVSYCAQIAGCFARILPNGKLFLSWYNTAFFNEIQLDGGTFGTQTTPYADGAIADGGDFTYTDTTTYDGGTFGDRGDAHFLSQLFDLTVDTDDVLITGVSVVLNALDNIYAVEGTQDYTKTLGSSDYIIRIENNPLIETAAGADSVCSYIYDLIVGIRFRPMNASCLENPSAEAGDVALVIDRGNNTYYCFLSHVTYTTGAATSVSCDATSTMQNLKARYSEAQKTRALAQRTFDKSITSAETAMSTILTAIATTMGLYQYEDHDSEGGTIYIYGNKSTLASSDIRWKFSAGAVMVSSDYGQTWNGAITADGQAVLQEIYAVKVNADNIQAGHLSANRIQGGTLTLGGNNNTNGILEIFNSSGGRVGRWDNAGLYLGNITSNLTDPNTSIGTGGAISTNSLTARDYVYVNGNAQSYLNIPMGNTNAYTRVESDGFSVKDKWGNVMSLNSSNYNARGFKVRPSNASATAIQEGTTLDGDSLYIMKVGGTANVSISANTIALTGANQTFPNFLAYTNGYNQYSGIGVRVTGSFNVDGEKHRIVNTEDYSVRALSCYETPIPMFGDVGEGVIGDDGLCYVSIDPIFLETISKDCAYQVFLQKYGEGECYVSERKSTYFVVAGETNLSFAWEIKAKQVGFDQERLPIIYDPIIKKPGEEETLDYGTQALLHIRSIMGERSLENA